MPYLLLSNLFLAISLTVPPPAWQTRPQGSMGPEQAPDTRPARKGGRPQAVEVPRPVWITAPRSKDGLWLDEKGEPSVRITSLVLLALANEWSTMRVGSHRQQVRQGILVLKDRVNGRAVPDEKADFDTMLDDLGLALALRTHERMAHYRILHRYANKAIDQAWCSDRIQKFFPSEGFGDPDRDAARMLSFFLFKQIQMAPRSLANKAVPKARVEAPRSEVDPALSWLERCLKDTNANAERLLVLLLGRLVLDPPKEPPLAAGITGFAWKRAQRILDADRAKSGRPLPARLLFLDTLLRTAFLDSAFPHELRDARKKRLDPWERKLRQDMVHRKGLSESEVYLLMTHAMLHGHCAMWR